MVERQTAKSLYQKLEIYRRPYLDRARKAAELTIPSLIPKEGSNGNTQFVTPYQGVGARGVNHLTAKLLLALLPPNSPFFRLTISDQAMAALSQGQAVRAKVEEALGSRAARLVDDHHRLGQQVVLLDDALEHAGHLIRPAAGSGGNDQADRLCRNVLDLGGDRARRSLLIPSEQARVRPRRVLRQALRQTGILV